MASPTPKFRPQPPNPSGRPHRRPPSAGTDQPDVVDPIWLVKAIGVTILAALICGYLTLCLLFYQGQWQLILHPSRTVSPPATIAGSPFQTIHFSVDESASPQLTGWLLPAEANARYAAYTILYLPSGDGSLADATPTLSALQRTGINVFAFDYRGYGESAPTHPNQKRMSEDAASAWQYLTLSRGIPHSRIVLFGDGVGCSLAAQLAAAQPESPAVIFQSPRSNLIQTVLADPRTKSLPVRALFHEAFEITGTLSVLRTPKLFIVSPGTGDPNAKPDEIDRLTSKAAPPKVSAVLNQASFGGAIYKEQIDRFLDEYLR